MTDRARLREALLRRRRALGDDEVESASRSIVDIVCSSAAWRDASVVAAFYGVRQEPHTAPLLLATIAAGKELWLPAVRGHALAFGRVHALDDLVPATFGLFEPAIATTSLAELAPSLVLVPGLGFATSGARIGFGRGFYDRALAPLRERDACVRMGMCFATFLDPPEGPIPVLLHDVPMHQIATELGIATM
jgi:5-formyltetrahydrofolate cyclo-ligase